MAASSLDMSRVLRIVGFVDFVLAVLCIATPVLRSRIGDMPAYAFASFLLIGAALMYAAARHLGPAREGRPGAPVSSPAGMR